MYVVGGELAYIASAGLNACSLSPSYFINNKKLSCRRQAVSVMEYFLLSLKMTQGHSR